MIGVFVEVNDCPRHRKRSGPVGYVICESGCWEWVGAANNHGYGQIRIAGKTTYAHRLMFERVNGPIPEGLHLDHLCRNPPCVNPAHLEVVTCRENMLRGVSPLAAQAKADKCKRGHDLSGENLRWHTSPGRRRPGRGCRACDQTRNRGRRRAGS